MADLKTEARKARAELARQALIQLSIKAYDGPLNDFVADTTARPDFQAQIAPWAEPGYFAPISQEAPAKGDLGHYRNKAAVTYAVAVVEVFVQSAWRTVYPGEPPRIFGHLMDEIVKKLPQQARVRHLVQALKFLNEIRICVVHEDGELKGDSVQKLATWRNKSIWRDKASFDRDFKPNEQVCLDISKVVIPALKDAIEFIGEVAEALPAAALGP